MRFAVISDTHFYTNEHGKGSVFWNRPLPLQAEAVARDIAGRINHLSLDFVIHCGDLVDRPHRENYEMAKEWIRRLDCPCYLSVGNHDTMDETARDELSAIVDLPRGRSHYAKQIGPLLFLFLDCCYWLTMDGTLMPYRDQDLYEAGQIHGMTLPDHELSWLACELEKNKNRPVVLISHAPLSFREKLPIVTWPNGQKADPSGTEADLFSKSLKMELLQREKVLALIKRFPLVKVAFSGHWHLHDSYLDDGIVFCQTGALREYPFEFRVVEVSDDRMSIWTTGLSDPRFSEESYLPERGNAWVAGTDEVRRIEIPLL